MPMVSMVASGSFTGPSGIALGVPQRLITTATNLRVGTNTYNETGLYAIAWSYAQASACTGAGSALPPCFTWWDAAAATTVTATGGGFGALCGGGVTGSVTGAAVSALYGVSALKGNRLGGFEVFECASGGSGVSAYLQVSSLGTSHDGVYNFRYRIMRLDDWGV